MLKILNILPIFLVAILTFGCSDQDDCKSDLTGEVIEISTPKAASNTLANLQQIVHFNKLLLDYLEQNRRSYSTNNSLNLNTTYKENYNSRIIYSYTMQDHNISILQFVYNLNMGITTSQYFSEENNETLKINSINGTMSVLDTVSEESVVIKYREYTDTFKEDNESNGTTQYGLNTTFSFNSSASSCANGIYQLETIEPLTKSDTQSFNGGLLNINGTMFRFNNGETADVLFQSGTIVYGISALESSCE
jgi:hypothetical protein